MKLLFKQRLFSWFDSYDIYDEAGNTGNPCRVIRKITEKDHMPDGIEKN